MLNEIYDEKAENPDKKRGEKLLTKHPRERIWRHHSAQQDGMDARASESYCANFMAMLQWFFFSFVGIGLSMNGLIISSEWNLSNIIEIVEIVDH